MVQNSLSRTEWQQSRWPRIAAAQTRAPIALWEMLVFQLHVPFLYFCTAIVLVRRAGLV